MQYFKHSELVHKYHVSLKTVHNWIDSSKQNKLELKLHRHNSRTYIANTTENIQLLEHLAEKGKKYRNTLHHKVVTPQSKFYELYSRRQILDIITNLNIHREIPRQYNYIDDGAVSWDQWLNRLNDEEAPNVLKATIDLLRSNLGPIDLLLKKHKRVNVIDLGVGNALPIRDVLAHLLERGVLHRYIAIDISEEMLHIAKRNIKEWFGDKVQFEGHIRDMGFERFDDLLVDDMLASDSDQTINLVFLLGATSMNFRIPSDVLRVIYGSMGEKDLLIHTTVKTQPDAEVPRRYFYFRPRPRSSALAPTHSFILELLNIDESLYDAEMGFNEQDLMRYVRIRLKTALTIKFEFGNNRRKVSLEKGDTILLLRVWHHTTLEIVSEFEKIGFTLLQASLAEDRQYFLSISGIEIQQKTRES